LPEPGPPHTSVGRPCGNPPYVTSSSPLIPVGDFFTCLSCSLPEIFLVEAFAISLIVDLKVGASHLTNSSSVPSRMFRGLQSLRGLGKPLILNGFQAFVFNINNDEVY
jgi:hypothetical protein